MSGFIKEATRSVWMDTEVIPPAEPLKGSLIVDTVVIGGGIAGLSTAYELSVRGHKVALLDRNRIGSGMSSRTTAHLASIADDGFGCMIGKHGLDAARTFHKSHKAAIERIQAIQAEEAFNCGFRRVSGYLFSDTEDGESALDTELRSCRELGVDVAEKPELPIGRKVRCVQYAGQATFHPLQYLSGLARAIIKRGGRIYEGTCVESVNEEGSFVTVRTSDGSTVKADFAVVATNSPINDRLAIHTKQAPYRTYAMAFSVPAGEVEDALYWDTQDPYHYVRLHPNDDKSWILIAGGKDHKTGMADDADERFTSLETWTRELVPTLGSELYRWSGQVLEPVDNRAFIGRNPGDKRVFVATGDSGQGMTHGAAAGMLLADIITCAGNGWTDFYDPARKPVSSLKPYIEENKDIIRNLTELVTAEKISSAAGLRPGAGALVRDGIHMVAAYRGEDNELQVRSAVCTHMGCNVHWNSLEQCWDCPCHGSHFGKDGSAVNAPAISSLKPAESTAAVESVRNEKTPLEPAGRG